MKKYIFFTLAFILITGTIVYGIVINNQNKENINLTMQNNALISQLDTSTSQLADLEEKYNLLKSAYENFETENEELQLLVEDYETQISSLNSQINDMVAELNAKNELWQSLMDGTITEISAEDLEGVTEIRPYAFYGCANLTSVEFSNTIAKVGERAFENCTSLSNLILNDNLEFIGKYSFYKISISSLTLPSNLSSLGDYAFSNITTLTSLNLKLATNLTSLGTQCFSSTGITNLTVPENIITLNSAFYNCQSLEMATFEGDVDWSTSTLFGGASKLKKIVFKKYLSNVIESGFNFSWSSILETVVFEEGFFGMYFDDVAVQIRDGVSIIIKSETPPQFFKIDDATLIGERKIYVPDSALEVYKTHSRWSPIADSIFALSEYEALQEVA